MSDVNVDWTEEQFRAYLMIFAANSNFVETEEEKELILSKVDSEIYKKMHREFEKDNDYQRLQKIIACFDRFGMTKDKMEGFRSEVKQILNTEGYHDELEENMFLYLKKFMS